MVTARGGQTKTLLSASMLVPQEAQYEGGVVPWIGTKAAQVEIDQGQLLNSWRASCLSLADGITKAFMIRSM